MLFDSSELLPYIRLDKRKKEWILLLEQHCILICRFPKSTEYVPFQGLLTSRLYRVWPCSCHATLAVAGKRRGLFSGCSFKLKRDLMNRRGIAMETFQAT